LGSVVFMVPFSRSLLVFCIAKMQAASRDV
jgi:hypothetical protein